MYWAAWIYALLIVASFFILPTNLDPRAAAGIAFLCVVVHFAAVGEISKHHESDD